MEVIALRLMPGSDIRRELETLAKREHITAGVIIGAVGSLSKTCIRFANRDMPSELIGKHEILTLSGMISAAGTHLHMSVSNSQGECIGGHVTYGCEVYTTLELVIGRMPEVTFERVLDEATGFKELKISQ
ncbi:MAG: putative DNA-binding protein with PD1-like DNA-binding motif [Phormidesmis priestleyi Ana]|uniref:Putative DNA-binding protein with PD1-like DNA-binding motif n=1 Tax=Phormidesmis priestleyi Ana TaxID=1666911 RepID=A0A0P7ZXE2_9CYAN|nr:MAG: putative DNA-binding protein with PD1-like DNA-binding motif [Phormidesmis priestleyi Ana]